MVTRTVYAFGRSLTLARCAMFRDTTVDTYSLPATLIFMVAIHLTLVASKRIGNIYINLRLNETYFDNGW